MIFSTLDYQPTIRLLSWVPAFRRALDWIQANASAAPDGVIPLDTPDFYINVHHYGTKPRSACLWESHRQTADLQLCISGGEQIDWTPTPPASASECYNTEKDTDIWPAETPTLQTVSMHPGSFAVFLPGELHRPMIVDGRNPGTRKLVVKIPARLLSI